MVRKETDDESFTLFSSVVFEVCTNVNWNSKYAKPNEDSMGNFFLQTSETIKY